MILFACISLCKVASDHSHQIDIVVKFPLMAYYKNTTL